jgi:hypothetical protein
MFLFARMIHQPQSLSSILQCVWFNSTRIVRRVVGTGRICSEPLPSDRSLFFLFLFPNLIPSSSSLTIGAHPMGASAPHPGMVSGASAPHPGTRAAAAGARRAVTGVWGTGVAPWTWRRRTCAAPPTAPSTGPPSCAGWHARWGNGWAARGRKGRLSSWRGSAAGAGEEEEEADGLHSSRPGGGREPYQEHR